MRTLTIIILGLTFLSSTTVLKKNETLKYEVNQTIQPDYTVAIKFINDYLDYINNLSPDMELLDWVNERPDVTQEFKTELNRILVEAKKNNPELGLGFDPIINAQDSPDEFELYKTDSEYLVVQGVNWTDFKLMLKIKQVENKWLVDGAGIINIPESKRIKR